MLIDVLIIITIVLLLFFLWIVYTRIFGAEFVRTPRPVRKAAIKLLKLNKKDIFYDLGCGIGAVLLEVSPKVKEAIGIEIDLLRFLIVSLRIKAKGLKNVKVLYGNLFNVPLNNATKIFLFLSKEATEKIGRKLKKEIKKATIVSYKWPIKNLKLIKEDKKNQLYKHKI